MDPSHSSELVASQWGALRAGHPVEVLASTSVASVAALRQQIIEATPSIILISLNHKTLLEETNSVVRKQDLLEQAFPELFDQRNLSEVGEVLRSESLPRLKFIVQTGFYNKPGYLKFRDMMLYRSNKYNMLEKLGEGVYTAPSKPVVSKKKGKAKATKNQTSNGNLKIVNIYLSLMEH